MIIKIDETIMTYLEALHFDMSGLENIMKEVIINKNIRNYDKETYDYFMDEYKVTNRKYEFLKKEILNEYVPNGFKQYDFKFNFLNNEIELLENSGCECNVCK